MLEVNITIQNARVPVTILHPRGEIDSSNYRSFQSISDETLSKGSRYLLIDLADTPYISSAGLRVIHTLFNKLRDLHKDVNDHDLQKKMSVGAYRSPYLKVANLSPRVREAFELSGFDIYIETHEDIANALQTF